MPTTYNVYCDESRHTNIDQKLMVIGGLWLERHRKPAIHARLKEVRQEHRIYSEIKWTNVSPSRLDFFIAWADVFLKSDMEYRCIVVDKSRIDLGTYHDGDPELAFYKFYYEMLHQKMEGDNKYYLFLDFMKNQRKKRLHDLKQVLNYKLGSGMKDICQIQALDSKTNDLIQLTDILTGATGYAWNDLSGSAAKLSLCDHIARFMGKSSLKYASSSKYADNKFNIFKINI
jgi:hypothetical protein